MDKNQKNKQISTPVDNNKEASTLVDNKKINLVNTDKEINTPVNNNESLNKALVHAVVDGFETGVYYTIGSLAFLVIFDKLDNKGKKNTLKPCGTGSHLP